MFKWFKKLINRNKKAVTKDSGLDTADIKEEKKEEVEEEKTKICYHCNEELKGKKSAESNGKYYVICNKCHAVNKIENNKVYSTEKYTPGEITEAFVLFRRTGEIPLYYSNDGKEILPLPSLKKKEAVEKYNKINARGV